MSQTPKSSDPDDKQAKKLTKQKKAADALKPNVAEAQEMVRNDYFLGYGICPIVVPHLGGQGPAVVPGPLQRAKQNKAMANLRGIAGEDGSGLLRLDSQYALVFGVDPTLVDRATLCKDVNGPFQQVKWQDGAVENQITMYAGFHRTEFLKDELLKDSYTEYKKVIKFLQKHPGKATQQQKAQDLEKILNENGLWLCGFYDPLTRLKERFLADAKKSQTVLLQLSSNNTLASHMDTPLHHFNNIARTLAASKDPEDRNGLLTWAKSTTPGDVSTLLYKHKDVVELLASVHNIPTFGADGLTPSQLLEAKKTMWGLLEPFIRGGYYTLVYLSAPMNATLGNVDVDVDVPAEVFSQAVVDCFTKHAAGTVGEITGQAIDKLARPLIMDKLVRIFDKAFDKHLDNVLDYFGWDSVTWNEAMGLYATAVKELVDTEDQDENWDEADIKAWKLVPSKLVDILEHQRMTCYPFLPDMPCKTPMFSPAFLHGLYGIFKEITPALSLIAMWMVPGLSDFRAQRAGTKSKSTGEVATPSETCLVLQHLSYFQFLGDADRDWSHADFPKSGMVCWSPETKASRATEPVARLWLKLVAFILKNRTAVLLKNSINIERALSGDTREFGESSEATLQLALKKWSDQVHTAEKKKKSDFRKTEVHPRYMQNCPTEIYDGDEHHMFTKHPNFRRGLEWSTYNFLTSPAGNNTPAVRLRYSQALWSDYKMSKDDIYPMIENDAEILLVYRAKLHSLVTTTLGLGKWEFWFKIHSEPAASTPLPTPVDADVSVVRTDIQNHRFSSMLTEAFTKFSKALNKPGVCGVPTFDNDDKPVGSALHPAIGAAFENVYKASASVLRRIQVAELVHKDLAALERKDETHKLEKVSWYKFSNKFEERGIPIHYAAANDVEKHYGKTITVKAKKQVNRATEGSSEVNTIQNKEKRPAEDEREEPGSKEKRPAEDELDEPASKKPRKELNTVQTASDGSIPYPANQLALVGIE
ncbi:hypothetical protein B0H16DRAFT_1455120 [Mycena metata]|uniref:Uncharacterized protein n=1 Tax=Mycena metata TaxID=1033252 RepID=A0AAD7JI64_9AGAR|nr:hypothetical protein B0H16DRAFT_1455120 [Mycena metata]